MSVLGAFAGDGLAVVEELCGVRVQACKPPPVPVPKPGPCPGVKRAANVGRTMRNLAGEPVSR